MTQQTKGGNVTRFIETFLTLGGSFLGQPFIPLPWMKDVIDDIFAVDEQGRRVHRTYLLGVPRKNAKDVDLSTPILTADGWKTMGTIEVGDQVHTVDGSLTEVVALSDIFTDQICYEVELSDGQMFAAGAGHQWTVFDTYKQHEVVVTTEEMASSFSCGKRHDRRYSVTSDRVLDRPAAHLPVDPYVLGYWLGDGHSASGRFSVAEEDQANLVEALRSAGFTIGNVSHPQAVSALGLMVQLRELGVLGNKYIPSEYLLGSTEQRLSLLQGLMDSDGTVHTANTPRCSFTNKNENLADGVLFLARSLGFKATKKKRPTYLNGVDCGPAYYVSFTAFQSMSPFRLERKTQLLRPERTSPRSVTNKIKDVREVPTRPTRCLMVAHESHQFLIGEGLTPTHNSTLGAAIAVYMLTIDGSDQSPQIISAAGDRKQAKLVFDEAKRMIQTSPDLSAICTVFRDEIRCSATGGVYRVVSADAGLAHGLNPSCVIVDEFHVHKTDELYTALTTGSATRNQPLTLVISTAGHRLDSPLGQLYQYGRRVESGEVVDPSFGFRWYGPEEGEAFDPADPEVWKRFNPSWEIMNPDEFASAYRTTHEAQFIRYRLNGWTSTETAWLPHGAWDALEDKEHPLADGDEVVLGFDGAWKGDSTGLVAIRLEDSYTSVLGHWEAPLDDPHWRTPAVDVQEAIRSACRRYRVREIVADPFRFEQSLMELMEEGLPIVEYPTNALARIVPATHAFYEAVMDGTIHHDGNPSLARHLGNAVLKEDARGARITKEYRSSQRHIDLAVAAIIAHHRSKSFREEAPHRDPELLFI